MKIRICTRKEPPCLAKHESNKIPVCVDWRGDLKHNEGCCKHAEWVKLIKIAPQQHTTRKRAKINHGYYNYGGIGV